MKHSVEQKLFIYDAFVRPSSRRKCCRKYPDGTVSCKATIHTIVTKNNVLRHRCWTRRNLEKDLSTEEKLHDSGTRLQASPKKPLRLLSLQCRLEKGTAHVGTKLLKLRPYRTTVVHSLLPQDCKTIIRYCSWIQESVFNGPLSQNLRFVLIKHGSL
jgi:hypothetical protein